MTPEASAVRLIGKLIGRRQTLATAESLTGGLVGAAITAVPGASAAYLGGVISYATALKHTLAGVPIEQLDAHGPVSPVTARAMAEGVRARTGADWAIAVTGVAGPDPQNGHAPGEVWLAIVGPELVEVRELHFGGGREQVRSASVSAAIEALTGLLGEPVSFES